MSDPASLRIKRRRKPLKRFIKISALRYEGHSVSRLLENPPEGFKPSEELIDGAKELDRHYAPSRYPNFHPEGEPLDYYTKADAERAVKYAGEIIEFARNKIVQA